MFTEVLIHYMVKHWKVTNKMCFHLSKQFYLFISFKLKTVTNFLEV